MNYNECIELARGRVGKVCKLSLIHISVVSYSYSSKPFMTFGIT